MKKGFRLVLIALVCFLVASYFIPSVQQREVTINNNMQNVILSVYQTSNWVKWNVPIKSAWQKDSSSYQFSEDGTKHSKSILLPRRKITVTQINNLSYQVEETTSSGSDYFIITMLPHIVNANAQVSQNTNVVYAWNSNWFHKIFTFLKGNSFCEKTVSDLISYLNSETSFYGFPIKVTSATDTLFITRKKAVPRSDIFKTLPALFDSLDHFCRQNHLISHNRNIYYEPLSGDSLQILTGVNIDTAFVVEGINQFMQLPAAQIVAIADFEGRFADRPKVYEAMRKYLLDKELVKGSVCFEKYLSPLPQSDTSIIKMKLIFPIR